MVCKQGDVKTFKDFQGFRHFFPYIYYFKGVSLRTMRGLLYFRMYTLGTTYNH